jgi:hypothetical protein
MEILEISFTGRSGGYFHNATVGSELQFVGGIISAFTKPLGNSVFSVL